MRIVFLFPLVPLALLTACTGMEITQPPVRASLANPAGAQGLDVYAASRARGQSVPEFKGETLVTIRSFLDTEGPGTTEFAGARCRVFSSLYSAEITTPAEVVVPNFGKGSPVVTAECRANGRSATRSAAIVNESQRRRDEARSGVGIGFGFGTGHYSDGAHVGIGFTFDLSNPKDDVYEYPGLNVTFAPNAG